MLEINLLPVREARRAADLRQYAMQLVLAVLVVGGGVLLVHSRIVEQTQTANARVHQMQRDIDQFKPQIEQVAKFRKKKAKLEKKIDVIDELDRARSGPVRVLDEIASRAPGRLWLTDVRTEGPTIVMRGESLDNELVALFLRSLGDSEFFENVDLDSTELGKDTGGLQTVRFNIRAVLVSPKPAKTRKDA